VKIRWGNREVDIEWRWAGSVPHGRVHDSPPDSERSQPLMIFLHEGLGSVSMWKDFPDQLCNVLGMRGLVYSRPGYGQSTPRGPEERWDMDFMHQQAHEVLPALMAALAIDPARQAVYLFGHSDGASIGLLHAARFGTSLAGVVVLAPHILVEDITVASIEKAREAYRTTDLKQRLARHHADPDSAFWGWNQIWLDPRFTQWTIEDALPSIRCPVLAIQGMDDEYGSMVQIDGIAARLPETTLVKLAQCGHSPHKDQPDQVIAAVRDFTRRFARQ
jgi:pimeloyl-ACP methyl ester carboxylesterase